MNPYERSILVYDDLFDTSFIEYVDRYYSDNMLWEYSNTSGSLDDVSKFFYGKDLRNGSEILDCPIQKFIFEKVQKTIEFDIVDYSDEHIYINGQTYMLDGTSHMDEFLNAEKISQNDYFTILYMVNSDATDIQGFETSTDKVDFVPGRVILFNSFVPHRGLSTTCRKKMRMTLTWKSFRLKFRNVEKSQLDMFNRMV